jgi:hypothetical protein
MDSKPIATTIARTDGRTDATNEHDQDQGLDRQVPNAAGAVE